MFRDNNVFVFVNSVRNVLNHYFLKQSLSTQRMHRSSTPLPPYPRGERWAREGGEVARMDHGSAEGRERER